MAKKIWLVDRLEKLKNGKLVDLIVEVLDEDKTILVEIQKDQLFAGQNASGGNLAPSYFADPYFKSPIGAAKYAKFKEQNDKTVRKHNPAFKPKEFETPNLIINGRLFYNAIFAQLSNDSLILDSRGAIISKLESKYKDLMGLNEVAWTHYIKQYKFIERLQTKIMNFLTA
jgi:hypothetical protein